MAEQIERPSITQGNIASLKATLTRDNEAFPVADAEDVAIALVSGLGRKTVIAPEDYEISMVEEGVIYVDGPATLAPGCYGLEVKGALNGTPWRTYTPSALVVTYPTVAGGGTAAATGDRIDITMSVQMYAMSMRTMEGIQQAIDECEAAAESANDAAQAANTAAQGADDAKEAVEETEHQVATAEAARVLAEQERVNAEAGRVQAEESRVGAEQGRVTAELARVQAEQTRISAEETRQANEQQRISQEEARVSEFARLKTESEAATDAANASAHNADDKAALAQQKADYAQAQGNYAQSQGVYAKAQGDYAKAQGETVEPDHQRAESDHTRAESDHTASETAVAAANQAATAANNAAAAAAQATQEMKEDVQTLVENTDAVLGADDIPQFDVTETYAIGDFVMKDGKLYKFLTGHAPGAWNPQEVQQTNLVTEVDNMVKSDYEEVIIALKTETNDPLPNVEVVVTVEGEQSGRNLTTDAQGRCTTNVQKGLEYTVSCANVPNYLPVTDIVRRASLPTRYITVTYVEDDTLTRETVKITVRYSDQTLPKATWVRISYGGENYQLALNDQNIAETTVRLGTVYTVSFEDIDGYKTPSPQTYTASLHGTRNINVSYVAPVAGLKWLMKNNTERELNDVSDLERINGDIFGLIVQTSDLMAAGCSFVIPLPFLLTQSATGTGQWLSANVTVPQLNYFGSLQAALADFDGDANCAGIEQFISESVQQGTTYTSSMVSNCRGRVGGAPSFDDTKDYEAGNYVVYRNYLHLFLVDHAAGPWVDGETEQMTGFLMPDGVVRKCFSPAFAQIYAFRLLRDKVNEFTTSVFGIGSCNIASGNWWCSTQCNAINGVYLINGGFDYNFKYFNCNLLPVLAY